MSAQAGPFTSLVEGADPAVGETVAASAATAAMSTSTRSLKVPSLSLGDQGAVRAGEAPTAGARSGDRDVRPLTNVHDPVESGDDGATIELGCGHLVDSERSRDRHARVREGDVLGPDLRDLYRRRR